MEAIDTSLIVLTMVMAVALAGISFQISSLVSEIKKVTKALDRIAKQQELK